MTLSQAAFPVKNYDLALTLASGQAFRWRRNGDTWEGVIGSRWVRLRQEPGCIRAETADSMVGTPPPAKRAADNLFRLCGVQSAQRADPATPDASPGDDWQWLRHYLQTEVDLEGILAAFPDDPPMREAVAACRGLRLLRQEPWECLASFILSSTKQIVQIEQIVGLLCRRFGPAFPVLPGMNCAGAFPTVERLAAASEAELRECKMGFRAPYLSGTARKLAAGEVDLSRLGQWPLEEARAALLTLPGVGIKIADCVLLFAYGFQEAFPVDVWIIKALQQLYFPKRRPNLPRLRHFSRSHFGPYGGYAQQYLFHYMRTRKRSAVH
jgi:N-glycosylase/DNA lyase